MKRQDPIRSEGSRFLLALDAASDVHTSAGVRTSRSRGEVILEVLEEHPDGLGLRLERFGLAVATVDARRGPTGVITLTGISGAGVLHQATESSQLRVQMDCTINYESLDRAQGVVTDKSCYYIPFVQPAVARLEGDVAISRGEVTLTNGRLHVTCATEGFDEIHEVVLTINSATLGTLGRPGVRYRVGGPGEWLLLRDGNTDTTICVQADRRRFTLQPVGFQTGEGDPAPSGGTVAAQIATAQSVWEKACITLEVNPIVFITDAALKTSSDLTAIRNAFTDSDPSVIEVFFVANSLPSTGGGNAGGLGLASCKPVIAEPNSGNPVLLAHELGHVLGLAHPSAASNADEGTVMTPANSAMLPGSSLLTHFMCTNIANPALATLPTLCCLTHDIGNHYIRDFPPDAGQEPSDPLPAGMNRYAMSNVWNRLDNTPGTTNPTSGPEHQQPVRFNADMTPHTNYLFARVEQLVDLKVRNAIVKFYRKDPGSGGGAQNLHFIGQAPVASGLAVGAPQYVSIPWTLAPGTPAHSCIWAVAHSDAEPEGDHSSLDWWQFESLARVDNDWAQRNLDVENFAPSAQANSLESAVWFVHLPPPNERASPKMTLDVDAGKAAGLLGLALEIVGRRTMPLAPGSLRRISIDVRDQRGPLVVVLHAVLPGGARHGWPFDIAISPSMNLPMAGFMCRFAISGERRAVRQSLDVAASAALDASRLAGLASADDVFCHLKEQCERVPTTVARFARKCAGLRNAFAAMQDDLNRLPAALNTAAPASLRDLIQAIDLYEPGSLSESDLMARFRAFSNRLLAATTFLRV